LAADAARHPDPDDQADKYLVADDLLAAAGLEWYEISNWCRPGAECRHNQLYWSQGEYRGIGAAAHSHQVLADGSSRRWWNVRTPERYLRAIEAGDDPAAADDIVDPAARSLEALQLALRTRNGVPATALADDPLIAGLVRPVGDRLVLTVEGRLLANEVALRLLG
jgi:oxygen-independent coproporphyrinogen-3 oxidase